MRGAGRVSLSEGCDENMCRFQCLHRPSCVLLRTILHYSSLSIHPCYTRFRETALGLYQNKQYIILLHAVWARETKCRAKATNNQNHLLPGEMTNDASSVQHPRALLQVRNVAHPCKLSRPPILVFWKGS